MFLAKEIDCSCLTVIASIKNALCLFFGRKLFVYAGHSVYHFLPAELIGQILRKFGDTELLVRTGCDSEQALVLEEVVDRQERECEGQADDRAEDQRTYEGRP